MNKATIITAAAITAALAAATQPASATVLVLNSVKGFMSVGGPVPTIMEIMEKARSGNANACNTAIFKSSGAYDNTKVFGYAALGVAEAPPCPSGATAASISMPSAAAPFNAAAGMSAHKNAAGDVVVYASGKARLLYESTPTAKKVTTLPCGISKIGAFKQLLGRPGVAWSVQSIGGVPATAPSMSAHALMPKCVGQSQYIPSDWINATDSNGRSEKDGWYNWKLNATGSGTLGDGGSYSSSGSSSGSGSGSGSGGGTPPSGGGS